MRRVAAALKALPTSIGTRTKVFSGSPMAMSTFLEMGTPFAL